MTTHETHAYNQQIILGATMTPSNVAERVVTDAPEESRISLAFHVHRTGGMSLGSPPQPFERQRSLSDISPFYAPLVPMFQIGTFRYTPI